MRERKYSLPRHTNLASNGTRTGAFLIDFLISTLLTLGLFYGVFSNIFKERNRSFSETLNEERYASHLFFEDENGELSSHDKDIPNERFMDDLLYYYTVYLDEGHDEAYFNKEVLDIENNGKGLFKYQVVDEVIDKTKVAIFNPEASSENINIYLQQISDYAINYSFNKIPKVKKMINNEQFSYQLTFICSILPALLITYVIMPFIFKDGATVGKKIFGLSLANSDGYKISDWQILLRFVPTLVIVASLFVPIWSNLLVLLIVFLLLHMKYLFLFQ